MKSKKKKKKSFLHKLCAFFSWMVFLFLLCAFLARFVSPQIFWVPAFAGLSFPYVFLFSFLITVFWGVLWRRFFFIGLTFLIITSAGMWSFVNFMPNKMPDNHEGRSFKVMSYNVRMFNLYNHWAEEDNKMRRDSIFSTIQMHAPDIICLQEAYSDSHKKYKTIDTLLQIQEAHYVHEYYPAVRENHRFGIVTLSAYPIIERGHVFNEVLSDNLCIYTDVVKDGDTLRIYNAHFASIGLGKEDFVFVENISSLNLDFTNTDNVKRGIRKISGRLKRAFIERSYQVSLLKSHMESCAYPYILCTDLNDTPSSYAYRYLKRNLNDAFLKAGKGLGKTYNGALPYFRIDYILYSEGMTAYGFKTIEKDFSDHFPIIVTMLLDE